MTIALPPWLGGIVALAICGAAFLKGGVDERVTAGGILLSLAVTVLMRDWSWPHVQYATFAADSLLLALLVVVALRTSKFWPLAAAAFQLLAVMTHMAKLVDGGLQQWAYITAGVIWTYLQLITLAVGVWGAWRSGAQPARAAAPAADTRR